MSKNTTKDFSQLSELIEKKANYCFDKVKVPQKKQKKKVLIKHIEKDENTSFTEVVSQTENKNLINEKTKHQSKEQYQEEWCKKDFIFKKMIAKKNRKWLEENRSKTELTNYKEFPEVYDTISTLFKQESKIKWLIHIVTNFLPLNKTALVPKLPEDRTVCSFTKVKLTDIKNIKVGDRDKYLAFTGDNTTVVLSGIAVQELYRYVLHHTNDFYSPIGQIINYSIDRLRQLDAND